jgi:hypothetical protein
MDMVSRKDCEGLMGFHWPGNRLSHPISLTICKQTIVGFIYLRGLPGFNMRKHPLSMTIVDGLSVIR